MLRIVAPHFVAGIEIGGRTAPILRFMRSWLQERIERYCATKGWRSEII